MLPHTSTRRKVGIVSTTEFKQHTTRDIKVSSMMRNLEPRHFQRQTRPVKNPVSSHFSISTKMQIWRGTVQYWYERAGFCLVGAFAAIVVDIISLQFHQAGFLFLLTLQEKS